MRMISTFRFNTILLINVFILTTSTHAQEKDIMQLINEVYLIKSIPGGERAHVFVITPNNELNYYIGKVVDFKKGIAVIDNNYKLRNLSLNHKEFKYIEKLVIEIAEGETYEDTIIVKDNWQWHLYINGEKKAFWHDVNFEKIPNSLIDFAYFINKKNRKLYKLPGLS